VKGEDGVELPIGNVARLPDQRGAESDVVQECEHGHGPRRLVETGAIEILDVGALRIDALRITQADLDALLQGQPVGSVLAMRFAEGAALVQLKPFPGSARVGLQAGVGNAPFALTVDEVRVAGMPVPGPLVNWLVRHFDPTPRLRTLPVPISHGPIRILPGRLEIGDIPG
jgi:hypothetical protein